MTKNKTFIRESRRPNGPARSAAIKIAFIWWWKKYGGSVRLREAALNLQRGDERS